jgi:hypothetical protein
MRRCCSSASSAPGARPSPATCTRSVRAPAPVRGAQLRQPRCGHGRGRGCAAASPAARSARPVRRGQGGTLLLAGLEDLPEPAQRAVHADLEAGAYTRDGGRDRIPLRLRSSPPPARHRVAHHRDRAARPRRPARGDHAARAAAARLRRGRARPAAPLRRPAGRRGGLGCGASASRRRIGCATIPGPATCASSEPGAAPADRRRAGGDRPRGDRARDGRCSSRPTSRW